MPKPRGGRCKRQSYSSHTVRVPDPVRREVEALIDDFHERQLVAVTKPVTSLIEQLPVSMVVELLEAAHPKEWEGDTLVAHCELAWKWWDKDFDKAWEQESRPKVEKFNCLADQVNLCIWQVDNTFALACPDDARAAVRRLLEYGLLLPTDNPTPAASQRCLLDWVFSSGFRDSFEDASVDAFQEQRFDMLKALGIGQQSPVNRREYWHRKYKDQLAKTKVDYWQWRDNPEAREICPELTYLLELPQPSPDTKTVLECLADGKDPFFKPEKKPNEICISFGAFLTQGELADRKPEQKQAYREAFSKWHKACLNQVGEDNLKRIYKVVYGCSWHLIETIISPMSGEWHEVLGVSPQASAKEVKAAHRTLAKLWHPDVNASPLATENMTRINRAMNDFCNKVR